MRGRGGVEAGYTVWCGFYEEGSLSCYMNVPTVGVAALNVCAMSFLSFLAFVLIHSFHAIPWF